jgi:subtilisin family serine protease
MAQFPGLIILSAGNEHYDLDNNGQHYPASYAHENVTIMNNKNVIVVGCLSEQGNWGNLEQYSLWDVNQFEGTNYGVDSVDLFAPGAEIISTYLNSTYAFNTGTSMAAPLVTGVAALVLSAHPAFSSAQLRSVIKWSVKTISGLEGFCNTGGMVNAKNALEVADLTLGDLNGDDDVSNADIILLANYLANYITLSNYQKYCADLNFDGVINNADLILLAQMVVS